MEWPTAIKRFFCNHLLDEDYSKHIMGPGLSGTHFLYCIKCGQQFKQHCNNNGTRYIERLYKMKGDGNGTPSGD